MDAVPSSANGAHNDECRAVTGNGQQSGLRGRGPSVCVEERNRKALLRSAEWTEVIK